MIAPGNSLIQVILAIAFLVASGYALGRIHQWYRDSARRERAYRHGYDLASDSMFDMAVRKQADESGHRPGPADEERRRPGDSRRRIAVIAAPDRALT